MNPNAARFVAVLAFTAAAGFAVAAWVAAHAALVPLFAL